MILNKLVVSCNFTRARVENDQPEVVDNITYILT